MKRSRLANQGRSVYNDFMPRKRTAKVYQYMVELRNDPETGMLVVTVPALPGCCTQGRDLPQAIERIREAIEGYLECLKDDSDWVLHSPACP